MKKTIPFTITTKTIKCLAINLSKEVKDIYPENDMILLKDMESIKKWDHILYL